MKILNLPTRKIIYQSSGKPVGYRYHLFAYAFLSSSLKCKFEILYDYQNNCYILYSKRRRTNLRKRYRLNSTFDQVTWSIIRTSRYCFRAVRTDLLLFDVKYFSGKKIEEIIKKIENYENNKEL